MHCWVNKDLLNRTGSAIYELENGQRVEINNAHATLDAALPGFEYLGVGAYLKPGRASDWDIREIRPDGTIETDLETAERVIKELSK